MFYKKKFISNLFLKSSTNPDQMLRRFQNKSACLFFSPSLMTRGSIIYSSWPESSSLMRWVAWPGTGEGGIKAPAPVEWLAVWGLDAHHHGAAAQLSGGFVGIGQHTEKFSSWLPEYKIPEKRIPAAVRKNLLENVGWRSFQSVRPIRAWRWTPLGEQNPETTIYYGEEYL